MTSDYYKILGLEENASIFEIKKAYRTLAKKYHPDVSNSPNAKELFIIINEAYEYLLQIKLQKPIFKAKDSVKTDFNTEDWIKQERDRARRRAAYNAKKKYDDFKQTKIYKSALIISTVIDGIFILLSIMMILIPLFSTISRGFDPKRIGTEITAIIAVMLIGVIMLVMLIKNNHIFKKINFKIWKKNTTS